MKRKSFPNWEKICYPLFGIFVSWFDWPDRANQQTSPGLESSVHRSPLFSLTAFHELRNLQMTSRLGVLNGSLARGVLCGRFIATFTQEKLYHTSAPVKSWNKETKFISARFAAWLHSMLTQGQFLLKYLTLRRCSWGIFLIRILLDTIERQLIDWLVACIRLHLSLVFDHGLVTNLARLAAWLWTTGFLFLHHLDLPSWT